MSKPTSRKLSVSPGDRFGRGVVIAEIRVPHTGDKTQRGARLLCDCGTIYEVPLTKLFYRDRPTRSCGCLRAETARETGRRLETLARLAASSRSPEGRAQAAELGKAAAERVKHGLARHDGTRHPLYRTWANMMARCYDPENPSYRRYGGRGIEVSQCWHDVAQFIADIERLLGPRPDGMTLDREDNDGNYEEGNVRWADQVTQMRNSRNYIDGRGQNPLYYTWKDIQYRYPGELHEPWLDFTVFRTDIENSIGPRPEGLRFRFSRIDRALPYQPDNVWWH